MRAVLIALLTLVLLPAAALAVPPTISITEPDDGDEVRADFVIGTEWSDNTVEVEFRVDGVVVGTDTTAPYTLLVEDVAPGAHVLTAVAENEIGEQTTSAPVDITVDAFVEGEFTGATPAEGSTTKAASITVEFAETDPDDDDVTTECRVDNTPEYSDCDSPLVLDALGDGTHTVRVRFTDDVGNQYVAVRTFKVDRTAPVLTVTSPAEGAVLNVTAIAPGYQVDDAGGSAITVTCSLDGGAFGACSFPPTEGAHTLVVRAEDNVANRSEVSRTFTIDSTIPSISADAGVDGDDVRITFTTTDASPVSTTCALDGAPAAPCTSGITYSNLAAGEHHVLVRVQDAAGNARTVDVAFLVEEDGIIDVPAGGKKRKLIVKVPRRVDKSAAGNRMKVKLRTPNKRRCVVTLRASDGRVVIRRKIRGFRKYTVTLLLAKVEPGSYTVRVKCKGRKAKRKRVTITA